MELALIVMLISIILTAFLFSTFKTQEGEDAVEEIEVEEEEKIAEKICVCKEYPNGCSFEKCPFTTL